MRFYERILSLSFNRNHHLHRTKHLNSKLFSFFFLSNPYFLNFIYLRWNFPLTGDKKTDDDIAAFANARQRILSQVHK